MNSEELARMIARRLSGGLSNIDAGTAQKLQRARQAALNRYSRQTQSVFAWASATAAVGAYSRQFNFRHVLSIVGLTLVLIGGGIYWQAWQNYVQVTARANEIADIDAGLLTDDLPIPAYLDNGLDAWLKRSPQ